MKCKTIYGFMLLILVACHNSNSQEQVFFPAPDFGNNENPYAKIAAIPLPAGYKRSDVSKTSFAEWLRNIPLKKDKTVYLYDGMKKNNQAVQFAVLNIPVGNADLQQCADAIMRLRATYLFEQKRFDSIVFYDYGGKPYRFLPPNNPGTFNKYLQHVFSMCGSASLARQLRPVNIKEMEVGDILIRGGFPGHAVIVMDVAINNGGEKIYIIAQSYMPAQDIHLLINPGNPDFSPWYRIDGNEIIQTPEYNFKRTELKRW